MDKKKILTGLTVAAFLAGSVAGFSSEVKADTYKTSQGKSIKNDTEGSCGEAKCGEAKCGEGSCGEAKCGEEGKKKSEASCGAGSCG